MLPGIGAFTIVDNNVVSQFDLTNNFFCSAKHVGKPRAECCTELLGELNQDVKGNAHVRDPVELIQKDVGFFLRFSLVIATQLDEYNLVLLGDLCEKLNIPLVVGRSYGLQGAVRVYSKEHFCYNIDPYPKPDLRMYDPFPLLKQLVEQQTEFNSHIPYVLVLAKQVHVWKQAHGGLLPQTKEDKDAFKLQIKQLSLEAGTGGLEENLEEGLKLVYHCFAKPELPPNLQSLFADSKTLKADAGSETKWILAKSLKDFYSQHGELPLNGTIPDMTSTTDLFVQVQQCYNEQSKLDYNEFSSLVDANLKVCGKSDFAQAIPEEERQIFCKFASSQLCLRFRTLRDEFETPQLEALPYCESELSPFCVYVVWRACDALFRANRAYPGSNVQATDEELAGEADLLYNKAQDLTQRFYPSFDRTLVTRNLCKEMVRYGATEMHNVAAVVGGIAAQEAVKLITHQYEPLDHTYFFNGITAVGDNWNL